MSTLADPVVMVQQGAPRLIRDDEELREYTEALFQLTAKDEPTAAELDAIDLLTLLITTFEAQHRTLPKAGPIEVLRFLMERHGMTQRDLVPEIGSASLVSLILAGKRNLTVGHMHALGERFHVPAGVFLGARTA